jgi:hypothetical protein
MGVVASASRISLILAIDRIAAIKYILGVLVFLAVPQ